MADPVGSVTTRVSIGLSSPLGRRLRVLSYLMRELNRSKLLPGHLIWAIASGGPSGVDQEALAHATPGQRRPARRRFRAPQPVRPIGPSHRVRTADVVAEDGPVVVVTCGHSRPQEPHRPGHARVSVGLSRPLGRRLQVPPNLIHRLNRSKLLTGHIIRAIASGRSLSCRRGSSRPGDPRPAETGPAPGSALPTRSGPTARRTQFGRQTS